MCLPNKQYTGGHKCERMHMASKCEVFVICRKNFLSICKSNMTAKQGICKGHRCDDQLWLTNVKYFWLSLYTSWALVFCIGTHVCTISKVIGINEEKEMSAKQGIHKCS